MRISSKNISTKFQILTTIQIFGGSKKQGKKWKIDIFIIIEITSFINREHRWQFGKQNTLFFELHYGQRLN